MFAKAIPLYDTVSSDRFLRNNSKERFYTKGDDHWIILVTLNQTKRKFRFPMALKKIQNIAL